MTFGTINGLRGHDKLVVFDIYVHSTGTIDLDGLLRIDALRHFEGEMTAFAIGRHIAHRREVGSHEFAVLLHDHVDAVARLPFGGEFEGAGGMLHHGTCLLRTVGRSGERSRDSNLLRACGHPLLHRLRRLAA